MEENKSNVKVEVTLFEDRILVLPDPVQDVTAAGLYIPDIAKERPNRGKVVKVGRGRFDPVSGTTQSMYIHEGDNVVYSKHAGVKIHIDNQEHLIMRQNDCYASFTEEEIQPKDNKEENV